jgi:hypothetical protein
LKVPSSESLREPVVRLGFPAVSHHTPCMADASELMWVSLDPNPVIEAYKKDVDRTLLRENLKLTVEQRVQKMIAALRLVEEIQRSRGSAK